MTDNYCNNCGKSGHIFNQCKFSITSFGTIVFRIDENQQIQYLMIRRKNTLGYIDFMRGKYSIFNKFYILNMLKQMTVQEKNKLLLGDFDALWRELWGLKSHSYQYKNEENTAKENFYCLLNGKYSKKKSFAHSGEKKAADAVVSIATNSFCLNWTLSSLIEESNMFDAWNEPEWGFPKGRRNYQEKDYDCAVREMMEETGYPIDSVVNIKNIFPFEENFTGSNYKSYKHKYYLMYMDYGVSLQIKEYDKTEVDVVEWKTYQDCLISIRPYNLEKKKIITNVNNILTNCF
jgi:ADP-ribose pyrophosphatase YjhB (NUDIX family)